MKRRAEKYSYGQTGKCPQECLGSLTSIKKRKDHHKGGERRMKRLKSGPNTLTR